MTRRCPQSISCILMLIICIVGAMSQFLPNGSFKWITEKEIIKLDLDAYKENRKKGLTWSWVPPRIACFT